MILIVDDKPENLFSLRQLLELHNFEVDTAGSGREALKKVLDNQYALIILDVQMPEMDGFEVAQAFSGYSKSQDIPIIFLSAVNIDDQFIKKGYASGAVDYVTKPVNGDILLLKVKTFYRLFEQNQKLRQMELVLREEIEFRKLAERKKDEFISIASHELKTPLTSVKGYLQILQRLIHASGDRKQKDFIGNTLVQIDKLNSLVQDLLDVSKIESGKLRLNKKHFDFQNLLDNTIHVITQAHPRSIIKAKGTKNVQVYGDEGRIGQVLANYFTNAIKHSAEAADILVKTALTPDQFLKIQIRSGEEAPRTVQESIFNKFYRVDEATRQYHTLGIGPYICSEIIQRHGGKVGVQSEPGKGSSFYFTIPLSRD